MMLTPISLAASAKPSTPADSSAPANLAAPVGPPAWLATFRAALVRRPLWKLSSAADFLDLSAATVREHIQSGELLFAFDIGTSRRKTEPRLFSPCVVEKKLGPLPGTGATRQLQLAEVVDLVLPRRDLRSVELERILSCEHKLVYQLASGWRIARPPQEKAGPNAYTLYQRASVAEWLAQRRML